MRKTSAYARKRLQKPAHFNGAEWINAIGRCRPYGDEPVIGSWLPEGTTQIANRGTFCIKALNWVKNGIEEL